MIRGKEGETKTVAVGKKPCIERCETTMIGVGLHTARATVMSVLMGTTSLGSKPKNIIGWAFSQTTMNNGKGTEFEDAVIATLHYWLSDHTENQCS